MRNPENWQVYAQGSQPAMSYGGRGYTGHEQLNGFGIINMNARLYNPLLARFLAPDLLVGSGMTNDFNRYVYCRNNPLMFTDPSGESWKSFWSDFGNAFKRDFKKTFLSGDGFEVGWNSQGGFFVNKTRGGQPFGPSLGYNNHQITGGTIENGLHHMSPINPKIDYASYQMGQARQKYMRASVANKFFENSWSEIIAMGPLVLRAVSNENLAATLLETSATLMTLEQAILTCCSLFL